MVAACAGEGDSDGGKGARGSAVAAGAPAAGGAPGAVIGGGTPDCPQDVVWKSCSVEKRLTDAGFVPLAQPDSAPAGVFPVAGTTYRLGPAELHVYIFPSTAERERAVSAIDTVNVVRSGESAPWPPLSEPVLIQSNNLAAVLLSENARLVERVQLALTAGLPTPSR